MFRYPSRRPFLNERPASRTVPSRPVRCVPERLESRTLLSAGDLDTTFGGDGVVVVDDVDGIFNDVVVQGDGRLLAAGFARNAAGNSDFFLARFNPDGTPDATFGGGDGRVTADFGGDNSANRLALRPDGKIVAYGTELARFLPDGRLDTTFGGGDGFVSFPPLPPFGYSIDGLSLQGDNKIVLARNASVYRYTADGQLDTTFGNAGRFIATDLRRATGEPYFDSFGAADVAVQPGGGIVVAAEGFLHEQDGGPYYGNGYDFTVLRLTPSGQVDHTFANGDTGCDFFAWADADADDEVNRMSVGPDGRIAIVGTEGDEDAHHIFVDADGDHIVLNTLNWGYGAAHDIAFDSKGRTPSAGYQRLYSDEEYESKAVRAARDPTFGGPGGVTTNLIIGNDEALGLAVEADDDVAIVGHLDTYDNGAYTGHPFILRYEGETRIGISLSDGALRLDGTAADDTINVQATADSVVVRYNAETRTFPRSSVNAVFANGNGGTDTIAVSGIRGTLTGGAGDDTLRGPDATGVFLFGGDGNDRLYGGSGGAGLFGEGGNDLLVGGSGRDTLNGGPGDDTLDGGLGADAVDGGPGVDTADYSSRTANLNLSIDWVANDGEAGENGSLDEVEKIKGGSGNDRVSAISNIAGADGYAFFGNAGDDVLVGTIQPDALWGGPGNDYLDGGEGEDYLNGGGGNDTLLGGEADDALDDASGTNSVDGGSGSDTVNGAPETTQDLVLQAEDARIVGARVSRSNAGYTGTGYVDFSHPRGDSIEWGFDSPSAGTHRVEFRYANGSRSPRILQLTVNGRTIKGQVDFPPTGSWTAWRTVGIDIPVVAGANRVRVSSNRFEGPNIDLVVVRGLAAPRGVTLQAEQATLSGAKVANSNPGYLGTGYADYSDTPGSFVEWSGVLDNTGGTRTLTFRYANGAASDRPLELRVNGQVVAPRLAFAPTGTWAEWGVISVTVDLVRGSNPVRLTSVGPGGPNLDLLSIQ